MPLRLTAAQGGLGIELYEPLPLGPLQVFELSWSIPELSFPVDLSGGVRAFRNRRGRLERLTLGVELESLAAWLNTQIRGILGGLREPPQIWLVPCGLGIGVHAQLGTLAFELLWAPVDDRPRWVVGEVRGAGFEGPALVHALSIVDTALGRFGRRAGRVIELEPLGNAVVRALLPPVGFRTPHCADLRLGDFEYREDLCAVTVRRGAVPHALPEPTVRFLELALLTRTADEALFAGRLDDARSAYLHALERAPRHPEVCQMVAAIDTAHAERVEAALGLLVESLPATAFGLVGAELLAGVGDYEGAQLAVSRLVERELYAPLRAMVWLHLAELMPDPRVKTQALDQAIAASPANEPARFARFGLRVLAGDVNGALSDAEHLEAAAQGSHERHRRLVQSAEMLQKHGYVQPAGRLFERALRYLPKDASATLGLALALLSTSKPERAAVLLGRSIELAGDDELVRSKACLGLAKLLATHYRDLPQAIHRVRQVGAAGGLSVEARALEAAWRERIGDLAGATLAYARLRDAVELTPEVDAHAASRWLLAAAKYSLESVQDPRAAERHLAVALRLRPQDALIQSAYREAAEKLLTPAKP
ncbi:MAG: hypothetical protein RJA70_4265 [Pseudomonadota bacterium]|jgi:tetratricopeptide (TPR) repeat protein